MADLNGGHGKFTGVDENVNYAVSSLLNGKDNMGTRLWWDCNPAIIIK